MKSKEISAVGLDIGSYAVKCIEMSHSGGTATVVQVVPDARVFWTDSGYCNQLASSFPYGPAPCRNAFGSMHPGGSNFARVDGSVSSINKNIDLNVFVAMCTIAGSLALRWSIFEAGKISSEDQAASFELSSD